MPKLVVQRLYPRAAYRSLFALALLAIAVGCTVPSVSTESEPNRPPVRRFGEAAAAAQSVDKETAARLLTDTFARGSSVTSKVEIGDHEVVGRVRQVPANSVRSLPGVYARDKKTGAFYEEPRIRVRDPKLSSTITAPNTLDELLAPSTTALGVTQGGTKMNGPEWDIRLSIDSDFEYPSTQRAIDIFCTASIRRIDDTAAQLTVVRYCGTWVFDTSPDSSLRYQSMISPDEVIPVVADQFFIEP